MAAHDDPCSCAGVACDQKNNETRITEIIWDDYWHPEASLTGSIPKQIFSFTALVVLELSNNRLTGTLSGAGLSKLSALATLRLQGNALQGTVPWEQLSMLKALSFLDLGGNQLHGPLRGIGKMSSLTVLSLSENNFTGELPARELAQLTALARLNVKRNLFSATVPPLPFSTYNGSGNGCHFEGNLFSCPIPEGADKCHPGPPTCGCTGRSAQLATQDCNIWLGLHASLADAAWLQQRCGAAVNATDPCGCAGVECTAVSGALRVTSLSWNSARALPVQSDTMLAQVCKWTALALLNLDNNMLYGTLPGECGKLSALTQFVLANNEISGPIPMEGGLGKLAKLTVLNLGSNRLSGTIAPSVSMLTRLTYLNVNSNMLNGSLPWDALSKLTNLVTLHVYQNQLTGTISGSLSKLTALYGLYANENYLTGRFVIVVSRCVLTKPLLLFQVPSQARSHNWRLSASLTLPPTDSTDACQRS
jgi:Leucine-rich repeat (LRR) protein